MLVKEVMNRDVKTARSTDTVKDAAKLMTENRIGSLVVVSGTGEVKGIITERDIMSKIVVFGRNADDVKVEEIMSKDIITISPSNTLEEAANLMTSKKIKKLPVVEDGSLVGIVTASDLIAYEKELIGKISTILTSSPLKTIGG